jgi:hypothetical protein
MAGDHLSDLSKRYMSQHGMRGLGFQEFRQMATTFTEKHLKYKADESDVKEDALLDL